MNDNKIIKDGNAVSGDLICYFKNEANSKKYCYYVLGDQTEGSPTVKVHVAVIKQGNEEANTPITDDEWASLKGIMGNVVQGKKNDGITYLIPNSDIEIVNEKVIAMPVSYDYVNKHKTEYEASKVADPDATTDAPAEATTASETPGESVPASEANTPAPETPAPEAPAPEAPTPAPNLFDQALNPTGDTVPVAPETNIFEQPVPTPAAPTPEVPVTDINGFSNMVQEQDKDVPKVPEAPAPTPAPNENDKPFGNIIPNESDFANEPSVPAAEATPISDVPSNINIDEIKNKCDEMVKTINAFSEELTKMMENLSNQSAPIAPNAEITPSPIVEPPQVNPSPISGFTPEAIASSEAPAADTSAPAPAAASFETNWFDTGGQN